MLNVGGWRVREIVLRRTQGGTYALNCERLLDSRGMNCVYR